MSIKPVNKYSCCGCEACVQVCNHQAIIMQEDEEGFCYPIVDSDTCTECGLCEKVCQYIIPIEKNTQQQFAFGGHVTNNTILEESTSGGAFTAIVDGWCDKDYVVFGATSKGLNVFHTYINNKHELGLLRRSKYSQSIIGTSYKDAQRFLREGKKVLFSGTPCQIAGLKAFLHNKHYNNLLTIEVICEGVPSPLFARKYEEKLRAKYGSGIAELDYRYKDGDRWDYEVMYTTLHNSKKYIKRDRWFNPFWSIWINHLMSRPSCYECPYVTSDRVADITLGDLWGVHIYCPDLYNANQGASLVITNTKKGEQVVRDIIGNSFQGRELKFTDALRYQGPMRKSIAKNPNRPAFMEDLRTEDYDSICKKWAERPPLKLLVSKYIFGTNRQKVTWWKIKQYFQNKR